MTRIFIIAKLVILKSNHMKKFFIILGLGMLLASCATTDPVAYKSNFSSCGVSNCEIASIHNHMWLD